MIIFNFIIIAQADARIGNIREADNNARIIGNVILVPFIVNIMICILDFIGATDRDISSLRHASKGHGRNKHCACK